MSAPDRDHLDDGVDMDFAERRHDELTRAPKSDPGDDAPRVEVTRTTTGDVRIDVADTAAVRPGGGRTGETAGRHGDPAPDDSASDDSAPDDSTAS